MIKVKQRVALQIHAHLFSHKGVHNYCGICQRAFNLSRNYGETALLLKHGQWSRGGKRAACGIIFLIAFTKF